MSLQWARADLHHLHLKAKFSQEPLEHSCGVEWAAEQRQIASGWRGGDDAFEPRHRTVGALIGYRCSDHLSLTEQMDPSSAWVRGSASPNGGIRAVETLDGGSAFVQTKQRKHVVSGLASNGTFWGWLLSSFVMLLNGRLVRG